MLETIAKRIVQQPLRSLGVALLAGAWLGYEPPRRGIMLGIIRMLIMSELRGFVDGMPAHASTGLHVTPPPTAGKVHDLFATS